MKRKDDHKHLTSLSVIRTKDAVNAFYNIYKYSYKYAKSDNKFKWDATVYMTCALALHSLSLSLPLSIFYPFAAHSECNCRRMCFSIECFVRQFFCTSSAQFATTVHSVHDAYSSYNSVRVFFGPTINYHFFFFLFFFPNEIMNSCFRFNFVSGACSSVSCSTSYEWIQWLQLSLANKFRRYRHTHIVHFVCAPALRLTHNFIWQTRMLCAQYEMPNDSDARIPHRRFAIFYFSRCNARTNRWKWLNIWEHIGKCSNNF